jgi:hypothetical protein
MVSAFFDLAEIKAREKQQMRMADWVAELDKFVKNYGKGVLQNAGKVSYKQAYLDKFGKKGTYDLNASGVVIRDCLLEKVYQRILIKHKKAKV